MPCNPLLMIQGSLPWLLEQRIRTDFIMQVLDWLARAVLLRQLRGKRVAKCNCQGGKRPSCCA